ncbi:magnesium-translocating P-type ATPase [Massilia sp. R2A-15]|uniref:magnesium-translocating P-type ATPase n=1 Tax=Massilia sp. R2A-15 TaxID=3064278 RepID=UPI002733717E|nr:magnesium-translocating P-type ATPase [Massilia sp. R2A-15]WLI90715.1 magnesium-translocating P-type ATPase [Massilia sp. R2A-15]
MEPTHDPWWLAPQPQPTAEQAAGLSQAEAALRLARYGANQFRDQPSRSLLWRYLTRFKNPLVLILLGASVASAFSGEIANSLIVAAIVLFSVTLDFVQEHRANTAAQALSQSVSVRAIVVRDGEKTQIPVRQVVPGDIALVSAGDLIPADCRVLESNDFFVQQALLTGESYPVEKSPGMLPGTALDLQEATNAVFMGTSVVSGSARILVVNTGAATEVGKIADTLTRAPPRTSFELGTRRFGMLILRLTVLMVMFVLLVNAYFHRPVLESFLFAVALAVGLTPELLPMVVSVTLARGALRMAKQQLIVKRMTAIQDLGSMDLLCTDKTGTLTEAKICLERHVDAEGRSSERVVEMAYLNSFFETGLKSALDDAILEHRHIDSSRWSKIDEVPFDFERRRVSVLIESEGRRWLVVKGAAEEIAGLCIRYEAQGGTTQREIDQPASAAILDQCHALEAEGLRVLGIAWREVPLDHPHAVVSDEAALVLVGFAAFLDPPKASAAAALVALNELGIGIKILTGDSDLVTRHVCGQLGIPVAGILTGKEIAHLDDHALGARVEGANLFCRLNPAQKNRVLLALKARGHVVGYLGDGINDAPSLHSADVGLSVDSGVDVAKDAADMILLKHDLHVIGVGVLEGRRTHGNIMKYIMMGTSSNFGNMFSMAGASLFLPFLPMLPTQILLNNLLYDVSELPIPFDQVDARETRRPRVLDLAFIRNFMLVIGPISSAFDFLTFYVLLHLFAAGEALFHTGWFVESLCTQVLVIFIIRTRGNPLKSRAHPLLTATSLGVVGLAVLLPLTPLGTYFGFVALPGSFYLILVAMVSAYLCMVEVAKRAFYRRFDTAARARRARG